MSLLMDALKKAEQEKKEAAKRLRDTAERDDPSGEQDPLPGPDPAVEATGEYESLSDPEHTGGHAKTGSFLSTMELKLEPIDRQLETRTGDEQPAAATEDTMKIPVDEIQIDEELLDQQESEPGAEEISRGESTILEEISEERTQQSPDATFHGINLDDTRALDQDAAMFEQTQQGEPYRPGEEEGRSYDETLPGVSAAQLSKDIGDTDLPTPVAAQTVFTASGTHPRSRVNWPLYGSLVAIVLLAVSVVIYFSITPVNRGLSQQLVTSAQRIEQASQPQDTLAMQQHTPVSNITPVTELARATGAEDTLSGTVTELASADTPGEPVITETGTEPGAGSEAAEPVVATDNTGITTDAAASGMETGTDRQPPVASRVTVSPALLTISKSRVPEGKSNLINQAYEDYRNGRLPEARARYEEALELYPDNRDALLGLAAISLQESDVMAARAMYGHLLRINPQDDLARAGLIGLQQREDMIKGESAVKSMLYKQPDNPFLYFTLGKIYAGQQRWADAQQSFFDAYRLNSSNASYALNLAISLDRMGQAETALDYYSVALTLADAGNAGFDSAPVINRIQTLTAVVQP